MVVAACSVSGDDDGELRSVVCAGGKQRREWGPGEERRGAGGEGECVASPGVEEGGNQAGGGQARWRCSPPSCFVRWHGKKTGMPPGGWAAQCWAAGGLPGKLR